MLSVKKLKKVYPGSPPFTAVNAISFELGIGEILGLLGPNGAGKTTAIQMLLGILTPTSGEISYFGKDFFSHRSEVLQHVSFASTYISLPYNLTVNQNLVVFGLLYGLSRAEIKKRVKSLLERFGIASKADSHVQELSAGQITRLMLVKAFMTRPRIVLLDEPTASLDPEMAKEVIEFVFEQRKEYGTSILYTSHNMAEVAEVCDRVLFMQKGEIIANDIPSKLARSVTTSRVRLQVGDGMKRALSVADSLKLPYKVDLRSVALELDEGQIAHFLSALAQSGVIYTAISIREPTLEDYFLHTVGKKRSS